MNAKQILHEMIVIERLYEADIDRVFAAFADPEARAEWSAPSDTAVLIYDEANFAVGGRDRFRCGARSDPQYHGEARYLDIDPTRHIIWSETIDVDGERLSASLTTVQFTGSASQTKLVLTVQIAALGGPDMIEGTRIGQRGALDNLGYWLRRGNMVA